MTRPFTLHFVYLNSAASLPEWRQLHRFLHPASLSENECLLVAVDVDMNHGAFLNLRARDWTENAGTKRLFLPYGLVASILEVRSFANPIGFVSPDEIREQSEAQS
jgi:hypothetical protein